MAEFASRLQGASGALFEFWQQKLRAAEAGPMEQILWPETPEERKKSEILSAFGEPRVLSVGELPLGLGEMRDPPETAYVWGELPPSPWVSIVGTRAPSKQGFRDAFFLARRLARLGVTVASGGALGVDSAAHLGALAGRGRTIVVAPTWLPWAYPLNNHRLFRRILESGGAYLSFAEPRAKPLKFAFFRRNEALMALCRATVLGECPHRSGAKNAMFHARTLGRARFALPFRFLDPRSQGTWAEIALHGAELLADEKPILSLLEEHETLEDVEMPPEQAEVVRAVRAGKSTVDEICMATAKPPDVVQHALLVLTLSGVVREDERGLLRYHSAPHERP